MSIIAPSFYVECGLKKASVMHAMFNVSFHFPTQRNYFAGARDDQERCARTQAYCTVIVKQCLDSTILDATFTMFKTPRHTTETHTLLIRIGSFVHATTGITQLPACP